MHFHPASVGIATLIEAHLHTHASTVSHSMRQKYRSAVYCFDAAQAARARAELAALQTQFDAPLATRVLAFATFEASAARYHNYYAKHAQRPFCQTYIEPKLSILKARLGGIVELASARPASGAIASRDQP